MVRGMNIAALIRSELASNFGLTAFDVPTYLEEAAKLIGERQAVIDHVRLPSIKPASGPLIAHDPILWTLSLLQRSRPADGNSVLTLNDLMRRHGLGSQRSKIDGYRQMPADQSDAGMLSVHEVGVVSGFLPRMPQEAFWDMRRRTHHKIDILVPGAREEISRAPHRLLKMFELGLRYFATEVHYENAELIPEGGKIVVAFSHPFPFVDDFSLMHRMATTHPERPWRFMSNINSISQYFPDWRDDTHFTDHIIGLEREGALSSGRVLNGREAVAESVDFLRENDGAVFFIAPEGPDAVGMDRVAYPHIGFARIALATGATILPVLFTGEADLDTLTYNVRGRFLEPIVALGDPRDLVEIWSESIRSALIAEQPR